jgi:hypothetical protein
VGKAKGANVKGKLVRSGSSLGASGSTVELTLHGGETYGQAGPTFAQSDGSFSFQAVAPGVYTLVIRVAKEEDLGTPPQSDPSGVDPTDQLKGAFSIAKSKITIKVAEGEPEVDVGTIDLKDPSTFNK